MKIIDWLAQRKKAIVGFVTPGLALLVGNYAINGAFPTAHEWGAAAVLCVLTALGVHQVPNKPKRGFTARPYHDPDKTTQAGAIAVGEACLIALLVVVVLWWCGVRP